MRRIATTTRHLNKFGPGRDGFANGDPIVGVPATDLEAEWFDSIQEEIAAVVELGGNELDPEDNTQLLTAIMRLLAKRPLVCSITDLPTEAVGPIIVAECSEVWVWTNTAYFTGYRSPLCGRPVDGHTLAPLVSEVDAIGGVLPKVPYARLWAYAQENGLVVSQATWTANIGGHFFVDVDADNFRVPDLRNMFRRYTGTDADTANARALGTKQADALAKHRHQVWETDRYGGVTVTGAGGLAIYAAGSNSGYRTGDGSGLGLSTETRGINVAYHPRIHA